MLVKEIMNKAVVIDRDMSVKEAAKIMTEKNIGCILVTKGERITGIVTEKDIVKNISDSRKKIFSLMSKNIVEVDENENIEDAAEMMAKNKVKHLPVIDKNEKLAGIITSTDIIAHSDDIDEDFFLE